MCADRKSAEVDAKPSAEGECEFLFRPISVFDARKGLRRCRIPGIGVRFGRSPNAVADFWWSSREEVLARFSSGAWRNSFHIIRADGEQVQDWQLERLADAVHLILRDWLIDGVDDDPDLPLVPEDD